MIDTDDLRELHALVGAMLNHADNGTMKTISKIEAKKWIRIAGGNPDVHHAVIGRFAITDLSEKSPLN